MVWGHVSFRGNMTPFFLAEFCVFFCHVCHGRTAGEEAALEKDQSVPSPEATISWVCPQGLLTTIIRGGGIGGYLEDHPI